MERCPSSPRSLRNLSAIPLESMPVTEPALPRASPPMLRAASRPFAPVSRTLSRCGCREPHPPWSQPCDHQALERPVPGADSVGSVATMADVACCATMGVCCFDWRTSA
jgi:hypothetical protein